MYSARILGCIAAEYSDSCEHDHFTNRLRYVNRCTDISMHTRCMPQTQSPLIRVRMLFQFLLLDTRQTPRNLENIRRSHAALSCTCKSDFTVYSYTLLPVKFSVSISSHIVACLPSCVQWSQTLFISHLPIYHVVANTSRDKRSHKYFSFVSSLQPKLSPPPHLTK